MVVKKKNLGIKMVVSLLFLLLSLFAYSTCFCASLTPINLMTLEQAQNFEVWLETIFEGQDLSAEQIRTAWNNFSFDSNVEYLENIVFFRSKIGSGQIALRAIPNNNTISDTIDNISISITSSAPSGLYLKYRTTLNSNDITITKSVNLSCSNNILSLSNNTSTSNTTGNCGYFFLNGTTLNYNDDLSILISTEINTFCKTPALYVKPYGTSSYYVMGLSQNMAVEENIGGGTGGDTGGEGGEDTDGSTTTPDYSEELDNINNSINNQGQAIIENQNQNTEEIKNEINEIEDFLKEEIPEDTSTELENALDIEIDVEDPTADFFTWFFENIVECFTVNENKVLKFTILEHDFEINSDDYILNIPILKEVVGIGSSIFIFYGIFQDIRREIEKVKEGKFTEIASEDISANMM